MTLTREEDAAIRASLLTTIASLANKHGGLIPSDELQKPISIPGGGEIRLWDQSGIVTRKGLRGPIALFSRRDAAGKSRYPDQWLPDGDLIYRYRSGGPNVADNVALRNAFLEQLPMIHFEQQREGGKVLYWASWPIFVSQDYPENNYVKISAAITSEKRQGEVHAIAEPQRAYSERTTMYREHQKGFRASVLRAYATRCAICRLELPTLIEAAHIIPDKEDIGYEILVNKKRYSASFYQEDANPDSITLESFLNSYNKNVWFYIESLKGKYYINIYYDNLINAAKGDDL